MAYEASSRVGLGPLERRNAGVPASKLRCDVLICISLSLEGVFQMVYILPERLLALVRPAFDKKFEV